MWKCMACHGGDKTRYLIIMIFCVKYFCENVYTTCHSGDKRNGEVFFKPSLCHNWCPWEILHLSLLMIIMRSMTIMMTMIIIMSIIMMISRMVLIMMNWYLYRIGRFYYSPLGTFNTQWEAFCLLGVWKIAGTTGNEVSPKKVSPSLLFVFVSLIVIWYVFAVVLLIRFSFPPDWLPRVSAARF